MKTKRLIVAFASFFLAGFLILSGHSAVKAGGGSPNVDISAAPLSLSVGQSAIISAFTYYYHCSDGNNYGYASECTQGGGTVTGKSGVRDALYISASGSGNTLSTTMINTDSNGNGSATLSSSVAETKTVTVYEQSLVTGGQGSEVGSVAVTFTAAASAPTATHVITHKTTVSASAPVSAPAPPAVPAPNVSQIEVGSQVVPSGKPVAVETRQPLVLSGKTVANGTVTLYIHSKLRTVTVKAGQNGEWKYVVADLPVGSHHIDAQVTDPATKQQSAKASLLDFTVKPSKNLALATRPRNSFNPLGMIALPLVIALAVMGLAVFAWRQLRSRHIKEADVNEHF